MSLAFHRVEDFDEKEIPTEMIRLLMDIGYVSAGAGYRQDAENIFEGIIAARPGSELAYIAYAFVRIIFGEYREASHLLVEKALKINPTSEMAKAFYGLLLYQSGRKGESQFILNNIIKSGKDKDAFILAESLVNEGK